MSYSEKSKRLNKTERQNRQRYIDINFQRAHERSRPELREMLSEAVRNTAALPLHSDGLPHNTGEGEQ